MNKPSQYDEIETQLKQFYTDVPVRADFVNSLNSQINLSAAKQPTRKAPGLHLQPGWVISAAVVFLLFIAFWVIGPQKVYATVQKLLGYIPGVGVVDTSASIRVLKEPVSQSRDGISISVTSAVLTADRTHLNIQIFGVPRSAYPISESISGCLKQPYLLLPDGKKLELSNDFPPIPARFNQATLVIPCIANTLPGSVPEDWKLPMEFIAAPADMTVMPVEEVQLTPTETPNPTRAQPTSTAEPLISLSIAQEINTENGYILVLESRPKPNLSVNQTGAVVITDAKGKEVPYSIPLDVQNSLQSKAGSDLTAYKFSAIGIDFPITFSYPAVITLRPDPQVKTSILFDAGENPQPGQEWSLNQTVTLAGHEFTLVSISASSQKGYDFHFKTEDKHLTGVGVSIEGATPIGGGGGGGGGFTNGEFAVSQLYSSLPSGKLTVVVSGPAVVGDSFSATVDWQPDQPRTDLTSMPALPAGTCADGNTVANLPPLPASMSGLALEYEPLQNSDQWGLQLYNLDGSGKTLVAANASWGALAPDGSTVIYSGQNGYALYDVQSGKTTQLNFNGYNPVWSPDGKEFAYVDDSAAGIEVGSIDGATHRQVSSAAYSSIVGWSIDGSQLYVAVMAAGGSAWQIEAVDTQNEVTQPLFTIEDGSYKAINPALSPNGQWLAYRGRDNSSVYLIKMDGSEKRLLLDSPAIGTGGIAWATDDWLAFSLAQYGSEATKTIFVNPDSCEGYVLSGLTGLLQAVKLK